MPCSRTQHGAACGERNPGPLDSECDALTLRHRAPVFCGLTSHSTISHVRMKPPFQWYQPIICLAEGHIMVPVDFEPIIARTTMSLRSFTITRHKMSRRIRKPTICICENKDADQLSSNCAFVSSTRIVQSLLFLNLKFQASILLL